MVRTNNWQYTSIDIFMCKRSNVCNVLVTNTDGWPCRILYKFHLNTDEAIANRRKIFENPNFVRDWKFSWNSSKIMVSCKTSSIMQDIRDRYGFFGTYPDLYKYVNMCLQKIQIFNKTSGKAVDNWILIMMIGFFLQSKIYIYVFNYSL